MKKRFTKLFIFFCLIVLMIIVGVKLFKKNTPENKQNEDDIYFENNGKTVEQRLDLLRAYIKKIADSGIKEGNAKEDIETDAKLYERKSRDVVRYLQQVATQEKESGKSDVASKIEAVAADQNEARQQVAAEILILENRGRWKTLFIGPDYDTIGKIKDSLSQNKEKIVEVAQLMDSIHSVAAKNSIEQQLTLLMGERQRTKTIIQTYEKKFSLFGWFTRWKKGYKKSSLSDGEEQEIMGLVEKAFRASVKEVIDPPKIENKAQGKDGLPPEEQQPVSTPQPSENI